MFKPLTAGVAAATLAAAVATPTEAPAQYYGGGYYGGGGCYAGEWPEQCRDRLRWERSRPVYVYPDNRRYYRGRRDNSGAAVAGAILGFALGAAIVGSQNDRRYYSSNRGNRSWAQRCARKYRSFDPYSGTYLSNSGYRRYCRL